MTSLENVISDAHDAFKSTGCPAKAFRQALKDTILSHIHELNNLDRMRAVLDQGVFDHDPATRLNNLHFLFPIAEAEITKCLAFAKDCSQTAHLDYAKEFKNEAKEWARLANQAAVILGIEPDLKKRKWYGISHFHGARESQNNGKWQRIGGQWTAPQHGSHHAFLSPEDAQTWADMQYSLLRKWAEDRGLECPYRVTEMGPKPGYVEFGPFPKGEHL